MKFGPILLLSFLLTGLILGACASSPKKKVDNGGYKPGVFKTGKSVTFVYKPPKDGVTSVAIIGDFNNWKNNGILLNEAGDYWTITFTLEYGIYQYKYILDGTQRVSDPYAEAFAPDGRGGKNSIVEVKKE